MENLNCTLLLSTIVSKLVSTTIKWYFSDIEHLSFFFYDFVNRKINKLIEQYLNLLPI